MGNFTSKLTSLATLSIQDSAPQSKIQQFQTTNNNDLSYQFNQHITQLLNIIIKNSIRPKRWRKVTNMMIHKLEGLFNINKLRVIHLFEADYNGLIGILFNCRVLYSPEKRDPK